MTITHAVKLNAREHNYTADDQAVAITSLVRRGDTLWCGLTGGRRCLVPFSISGGAFGEPVDVFPWAGDQPQIVLRKIHNAMGLLDDGRLVIGEGILFNWDGIPFEMGANPESDLSARRRVLCGAPPLSPHRVGPSDIETFDMRWMTGGRLLTYDPDARKTELIGQVQQFNYVQSMAVDAKARRIYGHTLGDCHFFVGELDSQRIEDHGKISRFAFHNLCIAPEGVVYGAWIDGDQAEKLRVLRYDPAKGYLERLRTAYLDDPGPRVQGNRGIDQWLVHSSGTIYFGTAGTGMLYAFDREALTVKKIAHLGEGGRVTTLNEDEQGRILFTAGFPLMHVGRLDPATGAIEDFGPVSDRYERVYFHGSAYVNGTLYLAETDGGVATLWQAPIPQ